MSERPDVLIALGRELDRVAEGAFCPRRRSYGTVAMLVGGLATALVTAAVVLLIPVHRTGGGVHASSVDGFAALNRARTPADLLTAAAFGTMSNLPPDLVLDADQSRLVLLRPAELAWVVPARSGLCLVVQSRSGGRDYVAGECATRAWAAQRGLQMTDLYRVVLVLPGHIHTVTIVTPKGRSTLVTPNKDGVVTTRGDNMVRVAGTSRAPASARVLYPSRVQTEFDGGPTPPDGRLVAHAQLTPATSSGISAEVRAYRTARLRLLWIDLRNTPQTGGPPWYAVWLRTPHGTPRLLGFLRAGHTRGGELTASGAYPTPGGIPIEVSITRAPANTAQHPGAPILTGTITPPR